MENLSSYQTGINGSKRIIVGIWDAVGGLYLGIHLEENVANAKRSFTASVTNPHSDFSFNKNDFELRVIGILDLATGKLECLDNLVLVRGVDCGEV